MRLFFAIKINFSGGIPLRSKRKCSGEHANRLGTLLAHKLPCRNAIRDRKPALMCFHSLLQSHALLRVTLQQETYFHIQLAPMQKEQQ